MTLGDLVHKYRDDHGLNMQDFADLCGLSKAYISILERNHNPKSGKPPIPSLETIKAISAALGLDFNDVIDALDSDQEVSLTSAIPPYKNILPLPKTYQVPLVGTIACGQPILAVEEAEETVSVPEWIAADFALRRKGDSMINARIFDGDIVYIREQPEVENGQIAAVRIDEEATLKKVYYSPDSDRIILRACNPMYGDMVFAGETLNQIQVLGLAVGFYSKVRHEQ